MKKKKQSGGKDTKKWSEMSDGTKTLRHGIRENEVIWTIIQLKP